MCAAIEAYAASVGRADRYHETMTIGFMALIHERICKRGDGGDWQGFSDQNPEIFRRDILLNYYPRDLLESAEARARLVLVPSPRQAKSAPNS